MSLLDQLREDAVGLSNALLPDVNEVRPLLGAVISRLEDLEARLQASAPTAATVEPAQPAAPPVNPELEAAKAALEAAQAKVAALEAG